MTVTPPTPSSDLVPVYLKVANLDGTPVNALVKFTPGFVTMNDNTDDLILVGKTLTGSIVNGVMNYALPATDDPDFSLSGWTYQVQELFAGGRTYSLQVPLAMKDVGINLRNSVNIVGEVTMTTPDQIFATLGNINEQISMIMQYGVYNPPAGQAIVISESQ